jgi:hypothetical protein
VSRKFKIRWIVNAVQLGKRGNRSINLGFCEKTKKVAFASMLGIKGNIDGFKPFVMGDIYVDEECEDGRHCWSLECPYNRATAETLKKYVGKKCDSRTFKEISDRLQEFGEHFISTIDWNENGPKIFVKSPLIFYFKKRDKTK